MDDVSGYELGQEITANIFDGITFVDVTGITKGKGFAGGMKRHGFAGQGAGHGNQASHRRVGGIGACATPGRVFKGKRMAGRMGQDRVTTQNLIPGNRGGIVTVKTAVKGGNRA